MKLMSERKYSCGMYLLCLKHIIMYSSFSFPSCSFSIVFTIFFVVITLQDNIPERRISQVFLCVGRISQVFFVLKAPLGI
jgi:hypothetical protein